MTLMNVSLEFKEGNAIVEVDDSVLWYRSFMKSGVTFQLVAKLT